MSTGFRRQRFRKACLASKLAMVLIAVCFMTVPGAPVNCDALFAASGTEVTACHAQTIAPLNMSFALPTTVANAIVPAQAFVAPVLALLMLASALLLLRHEPPAITHRRRFLGGIWATSLPFKLRRLHLPYFSIPRDA